MWESPYTSEGWSCSGRCTSLCWTQSPVGTVDAPHQSRAHRAGHDRHSRRTASWSALQEEEGPYWDIITQN